MKKSALLLSSLTLLSLFANPQNGTVVQGNVVFEGIDSPSLTVHTQGRAILNWDAFSIQKGEMTRFAQESENSAVLNRVMGHLESSLLGALHSNGRVYLVNPNGILVGKDATIDTASFIASSFDISNDAFLEGGNLFFQGESQSSIVNEGKIVGREGGVVLIAHRIENKGSLSAPNGSVLIGAGHDVFLAVEGKNFLYVKPELPGDGCDNSGAIDALKTSLEAHAHPYSLGIRNSGTIDALHLEKKNGEIFLRVKNSHLVNEGEIRAFEGEISIEADSGRLENYKTIAAKGGNISIHLFSDSPSLADQKPLLNSGTLDVSGNLGRIAINSPKIQNGGQILAEGKRGEIAIFSPGAYIETSSGTLSVNGEGGKIQIVTGSYFSSGTLLATGEKGGRITIEGERLVARAAHFNASGKKEGGEIRLSSISLSSPLSLNHATTFDVSGKKQGGKIELLSPIPVRSNATLNFKGKTEGLCHVPSTFASVKFEPRLIDPSPNEEPMLWAAHLSESTEELFASSFWDPEIAPFYLGDRPSFTLAACPVDTAELVDPNPTGADSSFGDGVYELTTGNLVVTKALDNAGGATNAGAVYLFNATTGALISTLTGSTLNDYVGGVDTGVGNPTPTVTVLTNGNFVVISSDWNTPFPPVANVGAATWVNGTTGKPYGASGTTNAVSSSNSLVGTAAGDEVGSGNASALVLALTNGNYVVLSPKWGSGGFANQGKGAVTWADGSAGIAGAVTSTNSLVGTAAGDQVGGTEIAELSNGNFIVTGTRWGSGGTPADGKGAATWLSGTTGNTILGSKGAVSALNSLVGSAAKDLVGSRILALTGNGNAAVESPSWTDNGLGSTLGAVTWINGTTGLPVGVVSDSNSLVGTSVGDHVGNQAGVALTNGNFVVRSTEWINDGTSGAGAVTWINGSTGLPLGAVTTSNSLVGTTASDGVGTTVTVLANGNFVVASTAWKLGVDTLGAVTWCDGTTGDTVLGAKGAVSALNSLVGTQNGDDVGSGGVIALPVNSNYVVISPVWGQTGMDPTTAKGAVSWGSGTGGTVGEVTSSNSLVGAVSGDRVGFEEDGNSVFALTNGNYVVVSSLWANDGTSEAGAVTWVNGSNGFPKGESSRGASPTPSNSLVGTQASDRVGSVPVDTDLVPKVIALANGNYVVASAVWGNGGISNAGAVTWGNGTTGISGAVSSSNSLVGTAAGDQVGRGGTLTIAGLGTFSGLGGIFSLSQSTNANYLVVSSYWGSGGVDGNGIGAITWGSGSSGITGAVSASNSLVGTAAGDLIGLSDEPAQISPYFFALVSPSFSSSRGAVTVGSSITGTFCTGEFGAISATNSFIGANTSSGLDFTSPTSIIDESFGVQFTSYDSQTKVFVFLTPSPPTMMTSASAIGMHDFDVAISEAFLRWNWLSMQGYLDASSVYPPSSTYKGLDLYVPSLLIPREIEN